MLCHGPLGYPASSTVSMANVELATACTGKPVASATCRDHSRTCEVGFDVTAGWNRSTCSWASGGPERVRWLLPLTAGGHAVRWARSRVCHNRDDGRDESCDACDNRGGVQHRRRDHGDSAAQQAARNAYLARWRGVIRRSRRDELSFGQGTVGHPTNVRHLDHGRVLETSSS